MKGTLGRCHDTWCSYKMFVNALVSALVASLVELAREPVQVRGVRGTEVPARAVHYVGSKARGRPLRNTGPIRGRVSLQSPDI